MDGDDECEDELVSLGSSKRDLERQGYQSTESECSRDGCDGMKWYDNHTTVCDTCSSVTDLTARNTMTKAPSPWERYRGDPPEYQNSKKVRLPGGFIEPYDWVESDEVDGTVSGLDAHEFYL